MEARFGVMLFDCCPVRRVEDAVDLVLTFIEEDVVMGHSELIGGRGLQFLQHVCGQGVHPMAVDEFRRLVHLLLRRGCWVFRSRPRSALVQRGMHKPFFKLSPGFDPWVSGSDDPASHGRLAGGAMAHGIETVLGSTGRGGYFILRSSRVFTKMRQTTRSRYHPWFDGTTNQGVVSVVVLWSASS